MTNSFQVIDQGQRGKVKTIKQFDVIYRHLQGIRDQLIIEL